jgi:hypothetical protein
MEEADDDVWPAGFRRHQVKVSKKGQVMERRCFMREFKVEIIKLVRDRGVAVKQAACDLNIYEKTSGKGEGFCH